MADTPAAPEAPTPPAAAPPPAAAAPVAPPAQVIYLQNAPAKTSRLKKLAVASVLGVVGLAVVGKSCGVPQPWNGGGYSNQPVISAPVTTAPTPPPPLSHVAPKVATSGFVGIHHVGNQNWVDVTVYVSNQGDRPVQELTINLEQNGAALTIVDTGGWNAVPNGVQMPLLGIGANQPVVLRVEQWTPNVPITIVVSGNGVSNDVTMSKVACPTTQNGDNIACTGLGS